MICQLVNLGAKLEEQDASGSTPLQLAILVQKRYDIIQFFLKAHADITVKDKNGNSLLDLIAQLPDEEYIYRVFNLIAEHHALSNHRPTLQMIAEETLELTYETRLKIFDIIYKFLPHTPLSHISTEMDLAISKDHVDAFFNQIHQGHPLFQGKLFLQAASQGACTIVKILHTWFHAELESQDEEGNTPLHLAAMNGHHDVVVYLLDRGAEVYVQNNNENTILFSIAKENTILLSITQAKTMQERKEMFCLIYDRIPKASTPHQVLWEKRNDHGCFHLLHLGYSIQDVCQLAAQADCVFTVQTLYTIFPDRIDIKKITLAAESAKATAVIKYIDSIPSDCVIL